MDYNPPGSLVHGIFQAKILEWVAISFSRGSFQARDWTQVFCIAGKLFTVWATSEAHFHTNTYICTYIHNKIQNQLQQASVLIAKANRSSKYYPNLISHQLLTHMVSPIWLLTIWLISELFRFKKPLLSCFMRCSCSEWIKMHKEGISKQ